MNRLSLKLSQDPTDRPTRQRETLTSTQMQTRQVSQSPGQINSATPHLIHEDTLTPLHLSKFKNSIQASMTLDESDDGGSDEEVARIADKSQKPFTASPFVANKSFAHHGMSASILSRRTPGANRMHNSHSSAFMPTHSVADTKSEKREQ